MKKSSKDKEDKDDYPSKIEKGLFLGSIKAAKNIAALKDLNITHILTVANGVQPHAHPTHHYKYKTIQVADKTEADLTQYFTECFDFIDEARNFNKEDGSRGKGGGVLVHCVAGMSRSVSIVVAYLMKTNRVSFSQAFEYVQSKRSQANPNDGFRQQLKEFEISLSLQPNHKDHVKKTATHGHKNKNKI